MRSNLTKGIICIKDNYNIEYRVSIIEYEEFEDETYEYRFYPNYEIIGLLNDDIFQGIPGLNLDLRKEVYIRNNMTPVFISERTPGPNRENLYEMLENVGMEYLNRLEWLIRTNLKYSGDNFYVIRYEEETKISDINMNKNGLNLHSIIRVLLNEICKGNIVRIDDYEINNNNRKDVYNILIKLYSKSYESKINSINNSLNKKGRKKKEISLITKHNVFNKYLNKAISAEEALTLLNISRSTFFRELKKYKEKR